MDGTENEAGAREDPGRGRDERFDAFLDLEQQILNLARSAVSEIEFLRETSRRILEACRCDAIELRLRGPRVHYRWDAERLPRLSLRFELLGDGDGRPPTGFAPCQKDGPAHLCEEVLLGRLDRSSPFVTPRGTFWTGDLDACPMADEVAPGTCRFEPPCLLSGYMSVALVPFQVGEEERGMLAVKSRRRSFFDEACLQRYEGLAQLLGFALADRDVRWKLIRARREVACLRELLAIRRLSDLPLGQRLRRVVDVLPLGWQFPEDARARVVVDGEPVEGEGYADAPRKLTADILVGEDWRGSVEVVYLHERTDVIRGPFLPAEQQLLFLVAEEIAAMVEQNERSLTPRPAERSPAGTPGGPGGARREAGGGGAGAPRGSAQPSPHHGASGR